MILTENALYAIHHLNGGKETIFGVPLITEDYKEFLNKGKKDLEEDKYLVEDVPTEELLTSAITLDSFSKAEHHLIIGNLMMGFSHKKVGVSTIVIHDDGTYRLEPMLKGHVLLAILNQAKFLQKTSEKEAGEFKYADITLILSGLHQNDSTILKYYRKGICEYNMLLVDFYDGVLEYNLDKEVGRSISALEIRKKIVEWTKVGEENESRNKNRL